MLSLGDIRVNSHSRPEYLAISLRLSKTDLFGSGVTLYVGATGDIPCSAAAVLSYLAIRSHSPGPLFVFDDGRPITHSGLITAV